MSLQGRIIAACVVALCFVGASDVAQAQQPPATNPSPGTPQQSPNAVMPGQTSSLDDTLTASEADADVPVRKFVRWNHYQGKYITVKVGGGYLYEYDAYAQNVDSKKQFALYPHTKIRDMRVLVGGVLKFIKNREVTYSLGLMWNGNIDEWVARQTGLMIEVPEIWGYLFVGRTKEGYSLNKVMNGYAGWTMERYRNEFHGKREYSLPLSARQHTPEQMQKLFKTY